MPASPGVLRHSKADAVLVGLSLAYAILLIAFPSRPLIALGLWWNANTVSHNFVHLPFFRSPVLNRAYSIYLTLLLAIPHSLWRERHLRHHSGRDGAIRWTRAIRIEVGLVVALWVAIVLVDAAFFATVYLPAYLIGLVLCHVQGHFEHVHGTTSHYGRFYNLFCFSTTAITSSTTSVRARTGRGFRVISTLTRPVAAGRRSFAGSISSALNRSSGSCCARAGCSATSSHRTSAHSVRFLPKLPDVRRVTIVGGGLFPRTALVLRRVSPAAPLTIVDASARNIEIARAFLDGSIEFRHCTYQPDPAFPSNALHEGHLVVIPLAFKGDREQIYREPNAAYTLVHDWIWRRRATGVTVSWLLLKRLNLITR